MAWAPQALLDGLTLPPQFSYQPYVVTKRNSITATAGAVIIQAPDEQRVHGDGTIPFSIEAMYPSEWGPFYAKYNTAAPTIYVFKGYWGEELEVYFTTLDQPSVRSRLFDVSGQLQVVDVTTDFSAVCTPIPIA